MNEEPSPSGGRVCLHCGEPIPTFAHANKKYCNTSCQNKAYRTRHPGRNTEQVLKCRRKNPDKHRKTNRKYMAGVRVADLRRPMLSAAKARAKKQGVPFNIDLNDIVIPDTCPVLDIPLVVGSSKPQNGSPTLDKIMPKMGYVKGNVEVISWRANRLKSDATPDEMKAIADYYHNKFSKDWMVPNDRP